MEESALPYLHPQGWLTHTPATMARSTVRLGQGAVPTLLSAAVRDGVISLEYHIQCGTSYAQPLDVHVVPGSSPDLGHPHAL